MAARLDGIDLLAAAPPPREHYVNLFTRGALYRLRDPEGEGEGLVLVPLHEVTR